MVRIRQKKRINLNGGTASSIGIWEKMNKQIIGSVWALRVGFVTQAIEDLMIHHFKGWYTGADNLQISKSNYRKCKRCESRYIDRNDSTMSLLVMQAMTAWRWRRRYCLQRESELYNYEQWRWYFSITDNVGSEGTDTLHYGIANFLIYGHPRNRSLK